MAHLGKDIDFNHQIEKYRSFLFRETCKLDLTKKERDLGYEVIIKLKHLHFLTDKIQKLQIQLITASKDEDGIILKPIDELFLYTEAFYYFAFRIYKILKKLPFGKGFKVKSIRDIRNHLIEHPEGGASGIVGRSLRVDGDGPKVKDVRIDPHDNLHRDKGLYNNLREFFYELSRITDQTYEYTSSNEIKTEQ